MSQRIEVDPIKCEAHGQCAELLPERIALDEWGYPLDRRHPDPEVARRPGAADGARLPDDGSASTGRRA